MKASDGLNISAGLELRKLPIVTVQQVKVQKHPRMKVCNVLE